MLRWIRAKFHPMHRLRRLRLFRAMQRKFDAPVFGRMHGYPVAMMWLRDLPALLGGGDAEAAAEARFAEEVRKLRPARFLDIGANLGSYSWLVRKISPETEALLFEPDAANASLLRRTIARNRFERMQVIEAAVADQAGTIEFMRDEASGTTGGVVDQTEVGASIQASYSLSTRVRVPCVTLDEFMLPGRAGSTILKIDVEGAEALVLQGGSRFVAEHRPVIFIEAFEAGLVDAWAQQNRYARQALDKLGNHILRPV